MSEVAVNRSCRFSWKVVGYKIILNSIFVIKSVINSKAEISILDDLKTSDMNLIEMPKLKRIYYIH